MKPELMLQIASPTAAAFALAQTLATQRAALAQAGVTYPDPGTLHLADLPDDNGQTAATFADRLAATQTPKLVLTCTAAGASERQIATFCAALAPHFTLQACLWLVSPEILETEAFAAKILSAGHTRKFDAKPDAPIVIFDALQALWPWEKALGIPGLVLRHQTGAEDVTRDFLQSVLQLNPDDFRVQPPLVLNIAALEFQRLVNGLSPTPDTSRQLTAALAEWACAQDTAGSRPLGYACLLSNDRINELRAAAQPATDYISRRFLRPSFTPVSGLPTGRNSDVSTQDLREVQKFLVAHYPRLAAELLDLAKVAETAQSTIARVSAKRLLTARQETSERPIVASPAKPKQTVLLDGNQSELIVHFGMHKTGSSSIQETLFHNRNALGKARYLGFGQVNGSFGISRFFRQKDADATEFDRTIRKLGGNRGIISAEGLTTLGERQLDAFLKAIQDTGSNARFIGYVREPIGYYTSMFQQTLKTHKVAFDDLATWFRRKENYYKWLDLLISKVGADRVRAFPFERRYFPDGNVVGHFLGEIGYDPATFDIEMANESLSATAVKALYCYRKVKALKDSDSGAKSPIGMFIQRLPAIAGPKFAFSTAVHDKITALNPDFDMWSQKSLLRPDRQSTIAHSAAPKEAVQIIHCETDLVTFSKDELTQIATWAKTLGVEAEAKSSRDDIDFVSETLHRVRHSNLTVQMMLNSEQPLNRMSRWIKSTRARLFY